MGIQRRRVRLEDNLIGTDEKGFLGICRGCEVTVEFDPISVNNMKEVETNEDMKEMTNRILDIINDTKKLEVLEGGEKKG